MNYLHGFFFFLTHSTRVTRDIRGDLVAQIITTDVVFSQLFSREYDLWGMA